ncbi:hypothetical protein PsorP6_003313 [Peronosclerospora sorghi]|uniref:Uncharacterized protein n=1 Tax=Peronosclerospora sorghi TaxID=230839 RepID=A0ACC0VM46_9STRA|nr:hypothetical protein PsorP6_003313 [Peronosclerospora sorghi]
MTNRAVQDSFGNSLDRKKSKNAAARDLVYAVKSLIEHFNKSSNSQTRLAELQRYEVESHKFVSHAPHRFLSMHKVLRRVLELWTPLTLLNGENIRTFPLAEKYDTLSQLYSLLAPAAYVMRDTQNGTEVTGTRAALSLAKLQMHTLSSETPLLIQEVDEPRKAASKSMDMPNRPLQEPEAVLVDHHDLDPVVQETRELLVKGMHLRFFGRYSPKSLGKGDSVRLKLIDRIVADLVFQLIPREQIEHRKALKRHIWSLIRELAIREAEKIEEKRSSSEDPDVSSAKRRKTTSGPRSSFTRRSDSEFKGLGFLDNDEDEDRSGGEVDDSIVNVEEKVDEEIRRFQASFGPKKASVTATSSSSEFGSMFQASKTFRTDEVLDFWLNINFHYSYLACVAR